jgi:hypothetical protein
MRLLVTAASVSVVLAAAAAAGSAGPAPALTVARHAVQGSGFRRHETVRVAFRWSAASAVLVRAGANGAFTAPLPIAYDRCDDSIVIRATGLSGDHAVLRVAQRACPPP